MWRLLSVPYIFLDFIRLSAFSAGHVTMMLVIKKSIHLGVLIIRCIIGGFILLLLFYFWFVSASFFIVMGVVKSKKFKKLLAMHSQVGGYFREPPSAVEQTKNNVAVISNDARTKFNVTTPQDVGKNDEKSADITNMFIKEFSGFKKQNDYFIKY